MTQPNYSQLKAKIASRKENVDKYREITGLDSLPPAKNYLTLCNLQPLDEGAEIVQLENMGFLKKNQFHGIDRDQEIIEKNKEWHPEAHWHCGEWTDIIRTLDTKKIGVLCLDTTTFSDNNSTADVVVSTMPICPKGSILFVNSIFSSPYSREKFDAEGLIRRLKKAVPSLEMKKWREVIPNYTYNATGRTDLITYIFVKDYSRC